VRQGRYYDPSRKALVYVHRRATPDFWERHWESHPGLLDTLQTIRETFVSQVVSRHLDPQDGWILEGGCGPGQEVAALGNRGYRAVGVDFAARTIRTVKGLAPDLELVCGDVRRLPFPDGLFAGYLSIGVIEHFWEGFDSIASEAYRVLRPGGYLILTFPHMSLLRRLKRRLSRYPEWKGGTPENFYQFALDARTVLETFERLGFERVDGRPYDGLKGTKDEIRPVRAVLQLLYDYDGNRPSVIRLRTLLSEILAPAAGHCMILVLQKVR
jgi:SAM-dependent methyltransferase